VNRRSLVDSFDLDDSFDGAYVHFETTPVADRTGGDLWGQSTRLD
jgi:hypothetical protein